MIGTLFRFKKYEKESEFYLVIKRIIEIVGSFVGILVCTPLLLWWIFLINLFVTKGYPLFIYTEKIREE